VVFGGWTIFQEPSYSPDRRVGAGDRQKPEEHDYHENHRQNQRDQQQEGEGAGGEEPQR
jgi:hypothetical protein